ncbi:MAG: putative ABC transport system permease protein [Saprospiraceae bacterium]|jgi:putative ABC transport system permease protein
MLVYISRNLGLALEGISQNKLRALLTALGIIFGVFAVVSMLAIGNGAKKSILDQLKIIGTNNIVINSIPPEQNGEDGDGNSKEEKKSYTPGLTLNDVEAIKNIIPGIETLSIETEDNAKILYGKNMVKSKCYGVNNDFFNVNNLELSKGSFFSNNHKNGTNVCVLGANAAARLFLGKNPIDKYVKSNHVVFKVIGVLKKRLISKENLVKLDVNNYSNIIFIPFDTYKLRINNKIRIGKEDVKRNEDDETENKNYHQLDKVVVKLADAKSMESSAELISRLLLRRHNNQADFEIKVPELLIKQQQNTQETMNLILAVIAGISLLVGGIGIMNIMLASVLERVKEIGLRRSIGATEKDITYQFLLEAIAISLAGGIIGVILGIVGAKVIAAYADISTVISFASILISFGIAVSIGIIFGIMPAQKAAKMDPITALRTD